MQIRGTADIGAMVGGGADDERGAVRDVLGPDTEAGQALWVAGIGVGILYLTAARRATGFVAKSGVVLETLIILASGVWAANYFGRMYALRHPNGPLAQGIHFDA